MQRTGLPTISVFGARSGKGIIILPKTRLL